MTDLIPGINRDQDSACPSYDAWRVNGVRYTNSAAKFWPTLLDEVLTAFPSARELHLSSPGSGPLTRAHLRPDIAFLESIRALIGADFSKVMSQAIAEFEMFGPPAAVRISVLEGDKELHCGEISSECLDEEIFACLVVWLLEWAGVSSESWDHDLVTGEFDSAAERAEAVHHVAFTFANRHLSEGLFERKLIINLAGFCNRG